MTARNGTPEDFPVESFRDGARFLRRPFTTAAVKFKTQAMWPKENPTGGLIVSYIDARLVVERLNLVLPHLWFDAYRPVGNGQMWCDLTVDGITRSDVGEGQGKGLVSDALKRAAVKFGIGVSLYAIPKMVLDTQSGALKQRQSGSSKTLELTPRGEALLRSMYAQWLDQHGRQAFGDPLDHGDVEDAAGDHEADEVPEGVDPQTGEVEPSADPLLTDAQLKRWRKKLSEAELPDQRKLMIYGAAGVSDPETITRSQAQRLAEELDAEIARQAAKEIAA
jgi:hypothetical protein